MSNTIFPLPMRFVAADGSLALSGDVLDLSDAEAAIIAANLLAHDLALVAGRDVAVVTTPRAPGAVILRSDLSLPPEAYRLTIENDSAQILASGHSGWLYGTQTLLQLVRSAPDRSTLECCTIEDAPLMPVRGQMLDVGRKFLKPEILRREIRRMAWYKLNSLHLHLSEWNGFRFGSERFPGLVSDEHYTLSELRDLDEYARRWGVTIVPEIDLPGHAVWLTAKDPRLRFVGSTLDVDEHPGGSAGGWTIDFTSDYARGVVKELLSEVAATFSGTVVHIGGDEVPAGEAVEACPVLAAHAAKLGLADPADVMVDFINDLAAHLRREGKTAELWEWWAEFGQTPTIEPDKDIRIGKWLPDEPPSKWAAHGWDTVGVNWNRNFSTPGYATSPSERTAEGFEGWMPAERNYEENYYPHGGVVGGGQVVGYRLGRWMDKAESRPYEWVDFYAQRGLQVIAERTWSLNGSADAITAFERVDAVGGAPGICDETTTLPRSALLSVAVSSSEEQLFNGSGDHLIDRDRRTTWVTRHHDTLAVTPHTVTITLDTEYPIAGLTITPRQDGGSVAAFHESRGIPRQIEISVGADEDSLVSVWQGELGLDLIAKHPTFQSTRGRVVRVVIRSDWQNSMIVALSGVDVKIARLP